MRILFYTDLHAADQTPKSRTGDYCEDMLAKLTEIIELANEYQVSYLINGADTFDRKNSYRVSHRLVKQMITIMRGYHGGGERHLTVVGTHDVPTGRLVNLPRQPLGVLEEAGVITVIGEPRSTDLYNVDNETPFFHGVPASYDLDKDPQNYAFSHEMHGNHGLSRTRPVITIAHGMIVPPGRTFFGDFTDADDISTTASMILYGHPHTPDGIYKNKSGTVFVGPGSVSRRDSSPYNRERVPKVVLIGLDEPGSSVSDRFNFKEIELQSARPPQEVFSKVIKDEQDENALAALQANFVNEMKDANFSEDQWGHDQLVEEIKSAEAPEEVRKQAEEILEHVTT